MIRGDRSNFEPDWQLDAVVTGLRHARERWRKAQKRHAEYGANSFPSRNALSSIIRDLKAALFPVRLGPGALDPTHEDDFIRATLENALNGLRRQVAQELDYLARHNTADQIRAAGEAVRIVAEFGASLPEIRSIIDSDVEAAYLGDPAARSVDEVLICYPGIIAIIHHRIAHQLYRLGAQLVARIISEIAHSETGIDIHPGAQIGRSFFIDHGTGVVIGETAIIGNHVRIYQAVTLGARSFPTDENGVLQKNLPRHPIIEDNVIIYAGATILGRITIGQGARIGGNVWLTESVPPDGRVNQAPIAHQVKGSAEITPKTPIQNL